MLRRALLLAGIVVLGTPAVAGAKPASPTAEDHLRAIVGASRPPEYRRYGSQGMEAVARYADHQLAGDGYRVRRVEFPLPRWAVDYGKGRSPALTRLSDGHAFKTESAFYQGKTTPPEGITCTVRKIADVTPGDCGFVPFGDASPEWKNDPFVKLSSEVATIVAKGGVGVVIQGDVGRGLVYAVNARGASVPEVVAVAQEGDVLGKAVRLRVLGASEPATGHDVVGVRRPPAAGGQYVVLLAHADGWFQAAADNGSGAAAALRAADLVSRDQLPAGVIVAEMDAEEIGLVGSKRLTELLSTTGLDVGDGGPPVCMSDVKAVMNVDASSARASDVQATPSQLLGQDVPLFQWRAFVFTDPSLLGPAFVARAASHQVLGLPVDSQAWLQAVGSWRTDAQWFAEAGVPVVWPVAGYPEYHTDGDTLAAVDPTDLENVALTAADTVRDAAALPVAGSAPADACSKARTGSGGGTAAVATRSSWRWGGARWRW